MVLKIVNQARFFTNFDYKMNTRILCVRIKYSMYDLICDVIICCVWICDMGEIIVYDKIVMKKRKEEKIWKSKKFIHKYPPKRLWNGIYNLLMRADARGSPDTIYCMWRISLLCARGIVNDVTKVGHAQNIYYQRIVLQCLIHTLTLQRNLISLAIFNTIFWKLGGGYFLGHPVRNYILHSDGREVLWPHDRDLLAWCPHQLHYLKKSLTPKLGQFVVHLLAYRVKWSNIVTRDKLVFQPK